MNWYLDTNPQQLDIDEALVRVSEQRRNYALRYQRKRDQQLCLSAWLLLEKALREEFGIEEVPPFYYTDTGKPLLRGHEDIHFSLSHCDEAVACAVSRHPVGIDIETFTHYDPSLLPLTMSDDEQQQILAAPRAEVEFTRLWTMKESLLKLTGEGMKQPLTSVLSDVTAYRFQTIVTSRFVCTICKND